MNSTRREISDLKRLISMIEGDIPNIKDSDLRAMKEKKLDKYLQELQDLKKILIPKRKEE